MIAYLNKIIRAVRETASLELTNQSTNTRPGSLGIVYEERENE